MKQGIIIVALLGALGGSLAAQKTPKPAAAKSHVMTGCVAGSAANYTITNGRYTKPVKIAGADDMGPHVGHTVQLKGTWSADKRTFNETKVTMKSESCSAGGRTAKKPKS